MIRLHICLVIILLSTFLGCTHLSEYQLVIPVLLAVLYPYLFLTSPSSTLNFFKFMTFGFIFHSDPESSLNSCSIWIHSFDTLALSDRICKYPLAAMPPYFLPLGIILWGTEPIYLNYRHLVGLLYVLTPGPPPMLVRERLDHPNSY